MEVVKSILSLAREDLHFYLPAGLGQLLRTRLIKSDLKVSVKT